MTEKAIQDYYPDHLSRCYGCGRLNEHGLQIKSYWDNGEVVCKVRPESYQIGLPGIVYGGLIASVMDCHSIATAVATAYRKEGSEIGSELPHGFMTASLHVDFMKPTPLAVPLSLRASLEEAEGRKLLVKSTLFAEDKARARGEVLIVRVPAEVMLGAD
jgi:acyl-coenzyme A thioesterase PaaI-like protein